MLKEFTKIAQVPGGSRKRWFSDDYFDLFVWYSPANEIISFQLCYDKEQNERALTWKASSAYMHHRVDDGESNPTGKATPVLVSEGMFDHQTVAERFLQESLKIDQEVARFVYEKLIKYV